MPSSLAARSSATRELAQAMTRVAAGDREAFEEVYRRTSVKLFGVCLRILPSRQEAEDVLQEVYLATWRRASSFDESRGSAMTWLLTLARNRSVDRLRAMRPPADRPIDPEGIPEAPPLASAAAEAADEGRRLADCMARLDAHDALLIRTAFFQGSTYAELAHRSVTPLGTVKSRIRRALLVLRDCLA